MRCDVSPVVVRRDVDAIGSYGAGWLYGFADHARPRCGLALGPSFYTTPYPAPPARSYGSTDSGRVTGMYAVNLSGIHDTYSIVHVQCTRVRRAGSGTISSYQARIFYYHSID